MATTSFLLLLAKIESFSTVTTNLFPHAVVLHRISYPQQPLASILFLKTTPMQCLRHEHYSKLKVDFYLRALTYHRCHL